MEIKHFFIFLTYYHNICLHLGRLVDISGHATAKYLIIHDLETENVIHQF